MPAACALALVLCAGASVVAAQVPSSWNVETGENVAWVTELGSYSYGGPVIAGDIVPGDIVLVGTNNDNPRDSRLTDDLGVLLALRSSDGSFLWQATHPKLDADHDYPLQGLCSTPTVVGDRVYYLANNAELVSVDLNGFRDGENDGPFLSEERTGETSADFVWRLDLRAELGVVPHFMSASTPAVDGELLFVHTSNGGDESGSIAAPEAPSFLAVERATGKVVWSNAAASRGLLDGQWSSPRVADLGGRRQVLFGGGDGRLYSFEPKTGKPLWSFDANAFSSPPLRGRDRNAFVATPVVVDDRVYVAVGRDPEVGSAGGGLWSLRGDGEGVVAREIVQWWVGGRAFGRSIANVTVFGGVVYAADLEGYLLAIEASTGHELWRYDALASVWATPTVIDGLLFVADTDGEVAILEPGPTLRLLREVQMPAAIYRAPVVSGNQLLLMTGTALYALRDGAGGAALADP